MEYEEFRGSGFISGIEYFRVGTGVVYPVHVAKRIVNGKKVKRNAF
jgi:hypothetical protein